MNKSVSSGAFQVLAFEVQSSGSIESQFCHCELAQRFGKSACPIPTLSRFLSELLLADGRPNFTRLNSSIVCDG